MIEIKNIRIRRGTALVFDSYSATILNKGATLLAGPNGAGKTTLVSAIAGSTPLEAGEILINGNDISALKPSRFAQMRSVAPQRRFFTLAFSVAEIIELSPTHLRSSDWLEVIETLGLNQLKSKKVTELSIGQQQRVSLGLSLIQEADFYLLDEPFSAQDSNFQKAILEIIDIRAKEKGVLVASHNTDALRSHFSHEITIK